MDRLANHFSAAGFGWPAPVSDLISAGLLAIALAAAAATLLRAGANAGAIAGPARIAAVALLLVAAAALLDAPPEAVPAIAVAALRVAAAGLLVTAAVMLRRQDARPEHAPALPLLSAGEPPASAAPAPEEPEAEELRRRLREVTHRSKNMLAVVQGIARQTAQTSASLHAFTESFGARVQALAGTHDLLVAADWRGAPIGDIARAQLLQFGDALAERVTLVGDPLSFRPEAAQYLALGIHELMSNAVKHGALSSGGGAVTLGWRAGPDLVEVLWTETGGPAVAAPTRRGFGRVMLERIVPASLDGVTELDFAPEGLRCRITASPGRLRENAAPTGDT